MNLIKIIMFSFYLCAAALLFLTFIAHYRFDIFGISSGACGFISLLIASIINIISTKRNV